MAVNTVREAIEAVDEVVRQERARGSPIGYFAALYRHTVRAVERGIAQGEFEDPERLGRLDVTFVNRYLSALDAYRAGRPTPAAWRVAFDAAQRAEPTVFQHLMVGMNAHIGFDLGIAAADACPGDALDAVRPDFLRFNDVLANLLPDVEAHFTRIWAGYGWTHRLTRGRDDMLADLAMVRARDRAWSVSERLARCGGAERRAEIDRLDAKVARQSRMLLEPPSMVLRLNNRFIRSRERGTVPEIIDILADVRRLGALGHD